jgi:cysteine desulfurase/selenocysteine lyase
MQEVLDDRREIGDRAAPHTLDLDAIRRDFPILSERVHGQRLVWLDNASTTQKPRVVIDRLLRFYEQENANVHRAGHTLGARATDAYEEARDTVRRFINAPPGSIIFVRGTTEGINLVANTWGRRHVERDDEIVVSGLEHHSNLVPWQMLADDRGARLRTVPIDVRGRLSVESFEQALGPKTRLVALTHMSNALGTVTPVKELIRLARVRGACVVVDGAQAVSHIPVDVHDLDADFYAFSGHKVLGPTGIGVLYGKPRRLDESPAWHGGGSMVTDVSDERSTYHAGTQRFEAGTPNIGDAVGLGAALDYLSTIGMARVEAHDRALTTYASSALATVPGLRAVGTAASRLSVVSFVLDGMASAEVGAALDADGIAVRVGHHCALPALRSLGLDSVVRPSLSVYNNEADIDALVASLHRIVAARRNEKEA